MTSPRLRERRLSRAAARAEDRPPPHPLKKFADKAHDLDLVRKSVDDAASVSAGLWLSYLFALFYIGVAAGGVTHKDLLLENPVRLPFLNVELPFVAFFVLAPVLFVVSHAYTLMHFVLLAAKVGAYNAELAKQIPEPDAIGTKASAGKHVHDHREIRRGLRRQLPSNIFVQFLAGPLDIREGGLGWLLKVIAWITLVIGPVLLLLLIQVQFLPYHLEWVTWVQRLAVFADVALLWALWPSVLGAHGDIRWPRLWRHPVALLISLVPIALAFVVARYPGEWVDHHVGNSHWIPPYPRQAWPEAKGWRVFFSVWKSPRQAWREVKGWRGSFYTWIHEPGWTSVHDLLFNGEVDDVTRRRKSLFSNTLVLPDFDGLAAAGIDPKKLDGDGIKHSLSLRGRHLKGAVLTHADLRKADLEAAKLQGAMLDGAQLQGATMDRAQLQGASFERAQLLSASFFDARLEGVSFQFARLEGARLYQANLGGASLAGAQLQGAILSLADLPATSFRDAELQGADFSHSLVFGADMSSAAVWRTSFEGASLATIFQDGMKNEPMSKNEFEGLRTFVMKQVPESEARSEALDRIDNLDPGISGPGLGQDPVLEKQRVDESTFHNAWAGEVARLVCLAEAEDAIYIVRRLTTRNFLTRAREPITLALVESILSPECPVSAALSDQDKANLRKLAREGQAHETKQ